MNDVEKFEERGIAESVKVVPYGERPKAHTPAAMIELAINRGADLEKLEKLMELQERYEQQQFKKDYTKAVAEFKANMPKVIKDKENKQYKSMYASESALLNTLNPILSQYGLSVSYSFPETEGDILKVTCIMTHENGYSDSVTLPGPIDTSGSKNPLQQVKSTVTYLRKATFEAITGIATCDPSEDDDGNSAGSPPINDSQYSSLIDMMNEVGADETKFCKFLRVNSLTDLPASRFDEAWKALEAKKAKK